MTMIRAPPRGTTGAEISRLGLGTWQMGGPDSPCGWGEQDDAALSVRTIRHAVERGMNWLDTAPAYGIGHSHEVVARALAELPAEERPYVFTKCGVGWVDGQPTYARDISPATTRRECEDALRSFGVERLDLLQIHWPVEEPGVIEAAWTTMAELAGEGKVRWIGVSNFDAGQLDRCQAIRRVDTVQPALSLLDRGNAADVLPWCAAHGAAALVYSPLQSGLLTGIYVRARAPARGRLAPGARNMRAGEHSHFNDLRLAQNLDLVERLRPVADRLGCTVSALAIAERSRSRASRGRSSGRATPRRPTGGCRRPACGWMPPELDQIAAALEASEAGLGGPDTRRP